MHWQDSLPENYYSMTDRDLADAIEARRAQRRPAGEQSTSSSVA
jgi:hypothetical protein